MCSHKFITSYIVCVSKPLLKVSIVKRRKKKIILNFVLNVVGRVLPGYQTTLPNRIFSSDIVEYCAFKVMRYPA